MDFSKILNYVLGSIVLVGLVYWGGQFLPDNKMTVVVEKEVIVELPLKKPTDEKTETEKKSWYNPLNWL